MGKLAIACVIIIIVFFAMLASRSQALQRFAVLELALVLAVTGSAFLGYAQSETFVKDQYLDMYGLYVGRLSSYMHQLEERESQQGQLDLDEAVLENLLAQALPQTTEGAENDSCLGAAIVMRQSDTNHYQQLLSVGKHAEVFGTYRMQTEELLWASVTNQQIGNTVTAADTGIIVLVDTTQIAPKYGLVVEVALTPLDETLAAQQADTINGAILLLTIGTLLLALIIFLQGREIRSAVRMITRVAEGKAQWEAGKARKGLFGESNEMRALRNSLTQLVNDNHRTNYMKYQMLQAYYRFAPKQIEKILNKPSILDVEVEDQVELNGTVAIVSVAVSETLARQEALKRLNENYRVFSEVRGAENGIFLCGNTDLSELSFLFPGGAGDGVSFGIGVVNRREYVRAKEQTFVLLHHTNLVYGVAGDDRQASTYVLSRELKVLEAYTEQLRAMGIRVAVTDSVYERLQQDVAARYIGFIEKGKYTFKLYEILDAYPAKERQNRLDTKHKFQDALNLFYQDDFYLARNLFTELLKDDPTDDVAKWYLFLCEKCLDSGSTGNISYGLFAEE